MIIAATTSTTCSRSGIAENVLTASLKKLLTFAPMSVPPPPARGWAPLPETCPAGPWLSPPPYSTMGA